MSPSNIYFFFFLIVFTTAFFFFDFFFLFCLLGFYFILFFFVRLLQCQEGGIGNVDASCMCLYSVYMCEDEIHIYRENKLQEKR